MVTALAAVATVAAFPSVSQALTFNFDFDAVGDGLPLDPPIVGTGTFSFSGDPGDGTFALTSLPGFDFSFNFDLFTFTNADLSTNPNVVDVIITTVGIDRFVTFDSDLSGPFGGSLEFSAGINVLSFDADGESGYTTIIFPSLVRGNFTGVASTSTSVPEPASGLGLLVLGGLGVSSLIKGKKA